MFLWISFCASRTSLVDKLLWTSWWNSYQKDGNTCCKIITKPGSKLSGALWRRGRKRKESMQLRLWNLNSTSNCPVASPRPSFQIPPISANVSKHWKTRARGNDVITNVIFANQHFASSSSMLIFKLQGRGWKLSFFFPPRRQSAPEKLFAGNYKV